MHFTKKIPKYLIYNHPLLFGNISTKKYNTRKAKNCPKHLKNNMNACKDFKEKVKNNIKKLIYYSSKYQLQKPPIKYDCIFKNMDNFNNNISKPYFYEIYRLFL